MDILKDVIYMQNEELLKRIANDKYNDPEEKEKFMKKYLKKNFCQPSIIKSDPTPRYVKKLIRCVK
jgi:hypothetical protein